MKIESDRLTAILNMPKHEEPDKGVDSAVPADPGSSGGVDRVDISISKGAMDKLGDLVNEMSEERKNKIASLKKEVESGTYQVDSKLVAKKMLEAWRGNN